MVCLIRQGRPGGNLKTERSIARARRVIESLYDAVCSVYVYKDDKDGKITKKVRSLSAKDVPCRIVYKGFPHTEEALNAARLSYTVRMYTSPDVDIPEGSFVEVTYKGNKYEFAMAGRAARYLTHQETELRLGKRWA